MIQKHIGIWIDHSVAHLMELTNNIIITSQIEPESKSLANHKEQEEQLRFHKKVMAAITNCRGILLFGPTTAKNELSDLLKTNHHFEFIKIETKNADNMTENQQETFLKEHFQPKTIHQN